MTTHAQGGSGDQLDDFSADMLEQLDQLLAEEGIDVGSARTIEARERPAHVPQSFPQELLWMLDRATPGLTAYNSGLARRVRGHLDVSALKAAVDALVARHEILRTTYAAIDEQPVQHVHPPRSVPFEHVVARGLGAAERDAAAVREGMKALRAPFDLTSDLLLRPTLVEFADDDYVLVLASHHIVLDGWARNVMFRDLSALYDAARRGTDANLPAMPIQYADFAIWQREHLASARLTELLTYWRDALAGEDDAVPTLDLPTDFPRPAHASFEGAQQKLVLEPSLLAGIKALAQKHDATLYMTLLAAYQTVLHRWTGQPDIISGSPVAGRHIAETADIVGYFANALPMHGRFGDDPTFSQVLTRSRETALGAFEHQELPLEKLVLELREGSERLNPAPIFQVVLTMHDMATSNLTLGDAELTALGFETDSSKFDLTLLTGEQPDGLRFTLQYRTDLFRAETAARFLGHLRSVLAAAVAAPQTRVSQLPLLTETERTDLATWNATGVEWAPAFAGVTGAATLVDLFEAQAARVSSRLAVTAGSAKLTYQELNARANQLAAHLRSLGTAPSAPVGLLLDRSAEAIVGLVGILKSGGAYVPLAIEAPAARLATQIGEAGIKVVVTSAALAEKLPSSVQSVALDRDAAALGALSDANVATSITPDDLAYVLYTSGSTGVPKGVAVTHANVVHYTRAVSRVLAPAFAGVTSLEEPSDGRARQYGLASTLAADLGNTSLYPALLTGATLHVLGKDVTTEPERFAAYMSVHGLDVIKITPNHLRALVAGRTGDALAEVLPKQWLVTGGEALAIPFARTLLGAQRCRVLNHYGPTETTVGVLTNEVTAESLAAAESYGAQSVPLGRPLANTHAYVVGPSLRAEGSSLRSEEQPVIVHGELWLGGAGVTQGYLKRDDLTAERFTTFNGERVYRTGDRVRRLADGTIEFLGRIDFQVKVRGYRVELGEIEQVLRANPGVENAAVVLRPVEGSEPLLVAYAVPKQAGYAVSHSDRPTSEKLSEWIAAQLPEYMVPNAVVLLDALPLTPNGKLDRNALPAPDAATETGKEFVAPSTATEKQLAEIWQDVLKKERVGATDNFLELGGHSLMAIRVLGKISKTFGVRLSLRTLFEAPTVAQLATQVDAQRVTTAAAPKSGLGAVSRDAYRIGRPASTGPGSGPQGTGGASE